MHIPFVDLKSQYYSIKQRIDSAIQEVIENSAYIRGKYVTEFEKKYAEKNKISHCIGVGNGTDAIYIILKMLGIGQGDEVITVSNSWISTSETITQSGARPVFIDIVNDYFTIDTELIEKKITDRTKAIIPVHLYGQPADMDRITKLCEKYKLYLIEDCAQAHFAEYHGNMVGTFGIAASFSFYPGKNLGAYGDAGAIITNSDELAEKCRMYANHGSLIKHQHKFEGINSRLDGIQAAILSVKLDFIDQWNAKRYDRAMLYNELMADIPEVRYPLVRPGNSHIFHVYCIRAERRNELQNYLQENGVETAIHYPCILPLLSAYSYLNHKPSEFPVSSSYQSEILSLPIYPEMKYNEIQYVVDKIKRFYRS